MFLYSVKFELLDWRQECISFEQPQFLWPIPYFTLLSLQAVSLFKILNVVTPTPPLIFRFEVAKKQQFINDNENSTIIQLLVPYYVFVVKTIMFQSVGK